MIDIEEHLAHKLTPFRLAKDADALIEELAVCFDREKEEKALILLNAAEGNPKMSAYQMSISRKALADVYYDAGFFGGALVQYQIAMEENKALPVKRRIKELLALSPGEQTFSASPDIVADVLRYEEYRPFAKEYHSRYDAVREEIVSGKVEIYDAALEEEIGARLDALGEKCKEEFYRARAACAKTEAGNLFTNSKLDMLRLKSMERTAAFYAKMICP